MIGLDDIGLLAAAATGFLLFQRYRTLPRKHRLPRYGIAGAVLLFTSQYLAQSGVVPVGLYFTPLAWTGYILWVDGAIWALRGNSLLRNHRKEFFWMAACSIPLWLIFEAYNLRLDNWLYVGLPHNWLARQVGYGWSFATIWPSILETATLLRAMDWNLPPETKNRAGNPSLSRWKANTTVVTGILFLVVPLIVPAETGAYLFGAVWTGFVFLLEPLHLRAGRESLLRDLIERDTSRARALLWAGLICGILWEFWNHLATARWVYTFPILEDWRIYAMPVPGYLGFPAFALTCFTMLVFVAPVVDRLGRLVGRAAGWKSKLDWKVFQL